MKRTMIALFLVGTLAGAASAHCDTLNGPVVKAAREALAKGDPKGVLVWVRPEDEARIKEAFARALDVRKLGGKAAELADTWFFETLVRVHRAGEGAPYTGLKAEQPGELARELDEAIDKGDVGELAGRIGSHAERAITEKFAALQAARKEAGGSVEKGREYVGSYVTFLHYVEGVAKAVHGGGQHAEGSGPAPAHAD
ncbi:MAG: DUF6448 family protein [Elusimicrobia bacterium]|nr:DUF6448 family protein [Elusimicrobiota bacterium]